MFYSYNQGYFNFGINETTDSQIVQKEKKQTD